jgi:hypothetical protein
MFLVFGNIEPNEATIDSNNEGCHASGVLPVAAKVHNGNDEPMKIPDQSTRYKTLLRMSQHSIYH